MNALYIVGDPIEDKEYYDSYLSKLFMNQFKDIKVKNFEYWRVYGIVSYKKSVINKAIHHGFQIGKKAYNVKVPEQVIKSNDNKIIISCLRGLFDTDGSFWCEKSYSKYSNVWKRTHNYHPEIKIASCSKNLLQQCKELLDKLSIESKVVQKNKKGFKCNRNINNSYALNIRKIDEIKKWFKLIGTSNPRHQTRYAVWNKL